MNTSNSRAEFGLTCSIAADKTSTSGAINFGSRDTYKLTPGPVYARRMLLSDNTLTLDGMTGIVTGAAAFDGNAQVETATAAGTITTAGNATVTVTAAGMTGSPKAISFAVALSDTAATWAEKARVALAADAAVAAMFAVTGSSTSIVLTRLPAASWTVDGVDYVSYFADDATLNIALADNTSAGITEAASSTATTAGVGTSGAVSLDAGDANGGVLDTITAVAAVRIKVAGPVADCELLIGNTAELPQLMKNGSDLLIKFPAGMLMGSAIEFVNDGGPLDVTVEVFGIV